MILLHEKIPRLVGSDIYAITLGAVCKAVLNSALF
jgi:hypothetical protein